MKLILLGLIAFVVVAGAVLNPSNEWLSFKKKFNKTYSHKIEEKKRMQIFEENMVKIKENNLKHKKGLSTFTMAINNLTDLTSEEIFSTNIDFKIMENSKNRKLHVRNYTKPLPDKVDWRNVKGVVSEVKSQLSCDSSWAFSSTGAIEGQWFLTNNQSVSLSEQNLVDCSSKNAGCNGGLMEQAFDYVIANNGIDTEASYPYKGINQSCHYDAKSSGANIATYLFTNYYDDLDLQDAIANVGPVAIAFDGYHPTFFGYHGGIWDDPECQNDTFNHAALVVGYGTVQGIDYWIVKNSWSEDWGEQGYFKMRRNNGYCRASGYALYPKIL